MTEALTVVSNGFSGVDNGEVSIVDNKVVFTPTANWNGTETFTYTVKDNANATATASVTVTVDPINDAPVANDYNLNLNEDNSLDQQVLWTSTDYDLVASLNNPVTDTHTITITSGPSHGTGSVVTNSIRYTPTANYNGPDSITYEIEDSFHVITTATITYTVEPVNDEPTAYDDSITIDEDGIATIDVLANDTDIDLHPTLNNPMTEALTVVSNGFSGVDNGEVSIVDNKVVFTPTANWNGTETFTYTVKDNANATATASVTVTVDPINDAPVANDYNLNLNEDNSLDQQVLWTSTDYDLVPSLNNPVTDTHTITITSGPSHGTGSVVTNSIRYTPTANYNGPDSITYEIEDSFNVITTATITYTVEPVNDEPTAYDDSITIDEDGIATIDVLANDTDIDLHPTLNNPMTEAD